MPSPKPLHAWLRRRQANQRLRHEIRTRLSVRGRPALYIPRARGVDTKDGDGGSFENVDHGREWFAERAAEGEAEDGIDNEVSGAERFVKVGREGDGEVG